MGRAKKEPERQPNEYSPMLREMLGKFGEWRDEMCLRSWGFRYSELIQIETAIARMHAAAVAGSKEAEAERDKLTAEYRQKWLPLRHKMEES